MTEIIVLTTENVLMHKIMFFFYQFAFNLKFQRRNEHQKLDKKLIFFLQFFREMV